MVAEALAAQIKVHQLTDQEIRTLYRNVSQEAKRMIEQHRGTTRALQTALAAQQVELWAATHSAVKIGVGDSFDATAMLQAAFDEGIFKRAGVDAVAWRNSMLASSRAGIDAFLARKEFNYTLSQRVYRNRALSQGQVQRTVDTGLALGKSAKEIAQDVKRFIDPATPGGASYAAMRLGRTEVQNAFHTSSVKRYQATPWVSFVKWTLSGSHDHPDLCNEYAESVHVRGKGAGVFRDEDVPAKPHPQCLCYIDPIADDMDTFAKNFNSGKYDNYIDEQMGCMVGA